MHRFSDGQIDVPGRNPKRRDGPVCYRVLASGAQVHSQTRPGVQRRIHARGMIARERTLKLRLAHRLLTRLRPASRPQQRAIRFSSLSYLLGFPFLGQRKRLGPRFVQIRPLLNSKLVHHGFKQASTRTPRGPTVRLEAAASRCGYEVCSAVDIGRPRLSVTSLNRQSRCSRRRPRCCALRT